MPPVVLEPTRRRRMGTAVATLWVVVSFLCLLWANRKHNELRQESSLDRVDNAPLPVVQPQSPAELNRLEVADVNLYSPLIKRIAQSDTEPDSDSDDEDEDDEDEDQESDGAGGGDPNETWPKQVARGCQLVELMKTKDSELEAKHRTPWNSCNQLEQYGWELSKDTTGDLGAHPNADEQKDSVNSALGKLGIPQLPSEPNDQSGGWQKVAWIHSRQSTVNGVTYPATGAYIINYYNPGSGIIIAANVKSAAKMRPDLPKDQLVPLGQWSDITALTWADMCQIHSQSCRTLRYVMHINIAGDVAGEILPEVIDKELDELGSYDDAVTVLGMPDSDKARAAIGFPNGRGVGYLLVQHKAMFGDTRTIREIKVWNSNNGVQEQMSFFNEVPNMLYSFS